jgi:hypothetical protein
MASIREHGRSGSALLLLLAVGCVSTDEPLFGAGVVPETLPDPIESSAQSSAPVLDVGVSERGSEQGPEPVALVVLPPAAPAEVIPAPPPPPPPADDMMPSEPAPTAPPFEPCAGSGLLLCDTFENTAIGAFPGAPPWLPELSGCGTHRVDASLSVSGQHALRALAGGYPECMLHADLNTEADVYLRSWVRLGAEPKLLEQYLSLLELGPSAAQDEPELRIGLRPAGDSLCTSSAGLDVSVSGTSSGPSTDCSGFRLEPERWYCLQAHVKRQGRSLDYELAVDGVGVLSASDVRLDNGWNDGHLYFKVGRAAYGASRAGSVWHDDVAVGREPVPCGP